MSLFNMLVILPSENSLIIHTLQIIVHTFTHTLYEMYISFSVITRFSWSSIEISRSPFGLTTGIFLIAPVRPGGGKLSSRSARS